ncbi:restriction endonuclease subunit S [Halanaerobium praevalens]|nr:restriction endonuclease subunit S [Halanaerobium praevalens]
MREYKRYEEYQDSGIEWIADIPKNWIISKIKYLVKEPVSDGPHETPDYVYDNGVPFLSVDSIQNGKLVFENCRQISVKDHKIYRNKSNPEKEDILLGKAASVGKVAKINVDFPFSIWSPLALIKPNYKIESSYLEYSMKSSYFQIQTDLLSNSNTQKNLGMKDINDILVLKPSIEEQQKIASFLDQKTAEIDEITNKKEKLIDQLEKYKKSVITDAVTKGKLGDKYLNEDGDLVDEVEMKDSGIEWIRDVPHFYDISKVKYIADIHGRIGYRGYTKDDLVDKGQGALTLGGKHINDRNQLDLSDPTYISWDKYYESPEIMIEYNNLVVVQRGSIGKVAIIDKNIGEATINPSLILVNNLEIKAKYFYYYLISNSVSEFFNLIVSSTAVPMISQEQLDNLYLPKIDKHSQNKIINYLDKKTELIDNLIQKTKTSIQKYKEYKKSLIFEAVTGKIDLRDYELKGGE